MLLPEHCKQATVKEFSTDFCDISNKKDVLIVSPSKEQLETFITNNNRVLLKSTIEVLGLTWSG